MRTRETFEFMGIGDLSASQKAVFEELVFWNYQQKRASYYNISLRVKLSESAVSKALRSLSNRGITISSRGSWHINRKLIQKLNEEQNKKVGVEDENRQNSDVKND